MYLGSTSETLTMRLIKHWANYRAYLKDNTKPYCRSYDVLKLGFVKIILLEKYPCKNKVQLLKRERYYIETIGRDKCFNKNIPSRTVEEYSIMYRILNKEKLNNYAKKIII